MKQATAIGASLMTIMISRIVTSNRPSKPRCSDARVGRVGQQQADAEEQGEEHHRQDRAVRSHRLDQIVGDDVDEGVDARRLLGARLDDLARAAGRFARASASAAARSTPAPGLKQIDRRQADRDRDRRDDDRIGQRPQADALQRPDLAHFGNADDQRREQQRDDQHEQQAQEDLADRRGDVGGDEFDPGGVALRSNRRSGRATSPTTKPASICHCRLKRPFRALRPSLLSPLIAVQAFAAAAASASSAASGLSRTGRSIDWRRHR